ncbi:hypothetical protein UVI_02009400 [Ustilaginoidea virens]|uniref:Uncharacterized protein n=1 Tax=Ustilaginoidea virens TaxID=1159556 RepID=A0A1B5KUF9_USTVR|nr:hypothetical protein UVI_02009400 [Ustilaginoidea virens]
MINKVRYRTVDRFDTAGFHSHIDSDCIRRLAEAGRRTAAVAHHRSWAVLQSNLPKLRAARHAGHRYILHGCYPAVHHGVQSWGKTGRMKVGFVADAPDTRHDNRHAKVGFDTMVAGAKTELERVAGAGAGDTTDEPEIDGPGSPGSPGVVDVVGVVVDADEGPGTDAELVFPGGL